MQFKYSIIIPVYNRPQEVEELLNSLVEQRYKNFEVLIIEDGSSVTCKAIVDQFERKLAIRYFFKDNTGPGPTRNFGYTQARGDYFVIFDSDCIIPTTYFEAVEEYLEKVELDAWGGPDRPHTEFSLVQRAMGYTMSSFLTTGGIRGGKKHVGWFQPRSFNMGISRQVFEKTGGFKFDRYAEDIEFSIRMRNHGFKVGLVPDAFVFHKRRSNFQQFFKQVEGFGKGRALVAREYPKELKATHWFPTVFVFFFLLSTLAGLFVYIDLFLITVCWYILYLSSIFLHSLIVNKNILVACLSVPSAIIQLSGYGIGFFKEWSRGKTT